MGHGNWKKVDPKRTAREKHDSEEPKTKAKLNWAGMDWTTACKEVGRKNQSADEEQKENRRLNADGSKRQRGIKKNRKRRRGGRGKYWGKK